MIDPELAAFAADGRALIVGAVDDDGEPHATRGWGFRLDDDGAACVVLDGDDERGLACLEPGRPVAMTAADVRSLTSVQLKGRSLGLVPVEARDRAAIDHYLGEFFDAIIETDGMTRAVLERIVPASFVVCRFACDAVFDQTPGPQAGAPVVAGS